MTDEQPSSIHYRACLLGISQILHEHDPACVGPDAPDDEYDPEAVAIFERAKAASSIDQLAVVIANVLHKAFDEWTASRSLRDEALARDIWGMLHSANP